MSLFVSWVIFPLLLTALSLGCGLLLEEAAGIRLHGVLVVPAGLAVIFVVTHFATATDATAELATPAVLAAAVVGFALSPPWRRANIDGWDLGSIDRWAIAVGVGTLALFSLPVLMTGAATFTGYIKLDDTATWLALTDQLMEHGRNVSGLAPSTYEATVQINLGGGYPWGAFPALGLGHVLLGTDSAWLFQPYLGLLGAMLALCLYVLSAPLVNSRPLRALAAFIASQSALLFGYYLWGGIKEMAAAWLLALLATLVAPILRHHSVRALLPLAIASSALIGVLSFGGVAWLGPLLIAAVVLLYFQLGTERTLRTVGAFVALAALVALPSVLTATTFLSPSKGTLTSATDLGNLFAPLKFIQVFGIWPIADFRHEPGSLDVTHVLIAVVIALAAFGVVEGWRRRSWPFLLYVGSALIGGLAIFEFASPWVGAKGLATASPAFLFAALVAAFAMFERGRRTEGALAAVAIIAGVLWSNALAYQGVTIAPRDRLHELEQIGNSIAGEGPTLMTDYEPYGVRHFLRKADPEGASELRRRPIPLRSGQQLGKIGYADIDEFQLDAVLTYRTLVLRRSPVASRPPSPYNLVKTGSFYEVWQRIDPLGARIVEHLSLGNDPDPTAVPACAAIEKLAREAGPNGMVAAVRGRSPIVLPLPPTSHPPDWQPVDGGQITPTSAGTLQTSVQIPERGRWGIWLSGSWRDRLELLVDGRRVADIRHELSHSGPYTPLADTELDPGAHSLALRYHGKDLHPGSGGDPFTFGPIALNLLDVTPPITYVKPAEARSLCGQPLDWAEAIAR